MSNDEGQGSGTDFRFSAKAVGGDLNEKWPVLSTDRPLPFWDGKRQLLHLGYVGSVPVAFVRQANYLRLLPSQLVDHSYSPCANCKSLLLSRISPS